MAEKIVCKEFDDFYDSIKDLEVRGRMRRESLEDLQKTVEQFRQKCLQWKIPEVAEKNPELKKMFSGFLNGIKEGVESWNNRFQDRAKQEEFERNFHDKFIVFIYGKVKAGKSTLGNFIATHHLSNQEPEFWVGEKAKKESEETEENPQEARAEDAKLKRVDIKEFKTNVLECTAEIQLFRLGGLVWVDTPGLGSTTTPNGALAKRYVEEADFVLYPTGYDSPMQAEDIQEISTLLTMQKPVHIIITKSDKSKPKKIDGKIVRELTNETEDNREHQKENVLKRLQEKLNAEQKKFLETDIFSISVKTAELGMETCNRELFENSNLPKFYERFNMLLQEKANNLKYQSPFNPIIGIIDVILGNTHNNIEEKTLTCMRHEYENLQNNLERQRRDLEDSIRDLRNSVPSIIAKEFDMHRIDKNNYRQQCKEIRKAIDEELRTKIAEICSKTMRDFATDFCKSLESIGVNDVQDITTTHEIEKKGAWGKAGGATVGGVAGSILGSIFPVIGTAIAGVIGTAIGGYIGDKLDSSFANKDIEYINVGDNLEETLRDFRNKLEAPAKTNVDNATHQMDNVFFNPLKQQFAGIEKEISNFSDELLKLKREYEQKRS